jgi:hypothetical protein
VALIGSSARVCPVVAFCAGPGAPTVGYRPPRTLIVADVARLLLPPAATLAACYLSSWSVLPTRRRDEIVGPGDDETLGARERERCSRGAPGRGPQPRARERSQPPLPRKWRPRYHSGPASRSPRPFPGARAGCPAARCITRREGPGRPRVTSEQQQTVISSTISRPSRSRSLPAQQHSRAFTHNT